MYESFRKFYHFKHNFNNLFNRVVSFAGHVLHPMLPPKQNTTYKLRPRGHSYTLPVSSNSLQRNFLYRLLYKLYKIKPVDNS